jgi:nitrate/nitrite transporter NarK
LGFWGFVKWEKWTPSPVFDINLFLHNKVFAFSNLAALVHYGATFGVNFLLSLYLQYVQGYSPMQAGSIILFKPVMQAIFSPFAGRLSDKSDPRTVASLGMGFTVIGLGLLIFLHEKTTLVYLIPVLLILGLPWSWAGWRLPANFIPFC